MVFSNPVSGPAGWLMWLIAIFLAAPAFGQSGLDTATWLTVTTLPGNDRSIGDYGAFVDDTVRPRLERVPGVSTVQVVGVEPRLEIVLDPQRLASMERTPAEVAVALEEAQVPVRASPSEPTLLTVALRDLAVSPDDLRNLVLWLQAGEGGGPAEIVALGDVATIRSGGGNTGGGPSVHGEPAIVLSVRPLPGADPIRLADDLRAAVADLNHEALPSDQIRLRMVDRDAISPIPLD